MLILFTNSPSSSYTGVSILDGKFLSAIAFMLLLSDKNGSDIFLDRIEEKIIIIKAEKIRIIKRIILIPI